MQIVIDIPEEVYSYVNTQWRDIPKNDSPISIMCNAIIDGTPLPKGHGRLIDAGDIALIDEQFYVPSDYYVAESAINDAPTIIEADRGEQDARI